MMNCPACDNRLTPVTAGGVTVDVCKSGCGGIWFDNFELPKLKDPLNFDATLLLQADYSGHVPVDFEKRRNCPKCPDIVMMRHFFSQRRQVQVDECPNCGGMWLDAGELAMIRKETAEESVYHAAGRDYLGKFAEFTGAKGPPATGTSRFS
jgi:Zn-finger nucleic acid-binding protein